MGQMYDLEPVEVGWTYGVRKLANGRQWRTTRPNKWQLKILTGVNKGQHEMNATKTAYLEFSSLAAAERGMRKFGNLLDLCDSCDQLGTLDDPLTDFASVSFLAMGANGEMNPVANEYYMAHEECGKLQGWELS